MDGTLYRPWWSWIHDDFDGDGIDDYGTQIPLEPHPDNVKNFLNQGVNQIHTGPPTHDGVLTQQSNDDSHSAMPKGGTFTNPMSDHQAIITMYSLTPDPFVHFRKSTPGR